MRKISYNSPVILTFSLICFCTLILNYFTHGITNKMFFSIYKFNFTDILGYFRLVGHVFGHSGFAHLFGNMTLILLVGPILEEKYGSSTILFLILFTAIFTGIINIAFTRNILLGASGIAFMFILLSSFVNIEKGRIPLTLIVITLMYVGNEVYTGLTANDNISHITHIIGGGCGALFGFLLNKDKL